MGSAISTEFGLSSPPVATKTKEATIEEMKQKALEIEECLSNDPVNLWHLRELALTRGGLLEGTFVFIVILKSQRRRLCLCAFLPDGILLLCGLHLVTHALSTCFVISLLLLYIEIVFLRTGFNA